MNEKLAVFREAEEPDFADDDAPSSEGGHIVRFTVPEGTKKMRLDAFLSSAVDLSRSRIKKLVEQGGCTVDGVCCRDADGKIRPGQVVALVMPEASDVLVP